MCLAYQIERLAPPPVITRAVVTRSHFQALNLQKRIFKGVNAN